MKTQSSLSNSINNSVSAQATMDAHAPHLSIEIDRSLTIEEASVLSERYRQTMKPGARKAGFFGRNIIEKILSQEDCLGIRAYFAAEENGDSTIVLVGLDGSRREMISGILGEDVIPCPPICGAPNSLNSNVPVSLRLRSTRDHTLTGEENHMVTIAQAKQFVAIFSRENATGVVAVEFSRGSLISILQREHCVGIRGYFSLDETRRPSLLVVGATATGDDVLSGPIFEGMQVGSEREGIFATLG